MKAGVKNRPVMDAQTLNCPMCGAPAAPEATRCDHCNAQLATVACPKCFGMLFLGAKFCPHCGAPAERKEVEAKAGRACPRCRVDMKAVVIGQTELRECPKCEGIWSDAEALQKICADREQQAAVLGVANSLSASAGVGLAAVRYVPCPVCRQLMNRVNFAHCSNVIVDVCKQHGTWFDKDELRRIVEFIRAGGLEQSRACEIEELERRKRELASAQTAAASGGGMDDSTYGTGHAENAISAATASVITSFFFD